MQPVGRPSSALIYTGGAVGPGPILTIYDRAGSVAARRDCRSAL